MPEGKVFIFPGWLFAVSVVSHSQIPKISICNSSFLDSRRKGPAFSGCLLAVAVYLKFSNSPNLNVQFLSYRFPNGRSSQNSPNLKLQVLIFGCPKGRSCVSRVLGSRFNSISNSHVPIIPIYNSSFLDAQREGLVFPRCLLAVSVVCWIL